MTSAQANDARRFHAARMSQLRKSSRTPSRRRAQREGGSGAAAEADFLIATTYGRRVDRARMRAMKVDAHFAKSAPAVRATYQRLLEAARAFGPVVEEPKKTSIHLVSHTAFAGVATRRASLILTLKSTTDIRSPRVRKREQTSAHRWHIDVPLTKPADVDKQLTTWLRAAYDLAGVRSTK